MSRAEHHRMMSQRSRFGVRDGFGTAEPMVSATFCDSRQGFRAPAGGSVTASFMPAVPEIFVVRRAGGRPGGVPGESIAAGHRSRPAGLPREGADRRVATGDARPAPPFTLSPENAVSAAGPWNSRRCAPTAAAVHADRRNCARRPSLQHGHPSAMRPWTAARCAGIGKTVTPHTAARRHRQSRRHHSLAAGVPHMPAGYAAWPAYLRAGGQIGE